MSTRGFSTEKSISTRNVAIVGHVDHGKSTYADALLAANGIIRWSHNESIRYLDSRPDEQERGITMESSAVSLSYRIMKPLTEGSDEPPQFEDFLINLIDTPGHVDFSTEVSTASRLCDGVLVVVDAVEGVCTQTVNVLRQAWLERLKPILVINKFDRLVTELRLSPTEGHHHLVRVVEQANAIMGSFFASERMEDDFRWHEEQKRKKAKPKADIEDASIELNEETTEDTFQERDDDDIYFAPETGNVIFASAIDGWAFRINQFARLYSKRLGTKEGVLQKILWGEFYLDPKTKRIMKRGNIGQRTLKPMFVQFILENIWAIYDCTVLNHNTEKVTKIISSLNIKLRPSELKAKDPRTVLTAIFSQWLPLAATTFRTIVEQVLTPSKAQAIRIPKILHPELPASAGAIEPTSKLEKDLYSASTSEDAYVVAYISKLFAVETADLPENQRKPLTAEEMRQRGRESREAAAALSIPGSNTNGASITTLTKTDAYEVPLTEASDSSPSGETLLGFARLYSGTLRANQQVICVLPGYQSALPPTHPRNADKWSTACVENLYMLMGRELVPVMEVPAGNVFGVSGLEGKVLRNATLCGINSLDWKAEPDSSFMVNLGALAVNAAPIVRVALEPKDPSEMNKLVEGLRLLKQADPCVETFVQETGEHVILTAGELHLERCLRDLRERFARIEIQPSPPIVPFRETAVSAPDMPPPKVKDAPRGTAVVTLPNELLVLNIRARPLPVSIAEFLATQRSTIKSLLMGSKQSSLDLKESEELGDDQLVQDLKPEEFWRRLEELSKESGPEWSDIANQIWAFGPKRMGSNILLDGSPTLTRSVRKKLDKQTDKPLEDNITLETLSIDVSEGDPKGTNPFARAFDESIFTAFQLATLRGPLCAEPITGMAFSIEHMSLSEDHEQIRQKLSQLTGALISSAQEAYKAAMLDWSPRLELAMYSCDIQATAEVLGRAYGVISRRKGQIVSEEIKEGTAFFTIHALLPVVESFGFADEIRTRTSGSASPQLLFHGFQTLNQDPFWVPTTEEELEDLGEKSDRENVAKRYMDAVRVRKGMAVEKKIIEGADKQRNLKRD